MVPHHQAKERLVCLPYTLQEDHGLITSIYSLATVNAFLFCVGATQVTRIFMYNQSVKGTSPVEEIKDAAKEQAAVIEGAVKDPKGAAKQAQKV